MPKNLFEREAQYDDEGRLQQTSMMEDAAKNKTQFFTNDVFAAGAGGTNDQIYQVAADKTAFIVSIQVSISGASSANAGALKVHDDDSRQFIRTNFPAVATELTKEIYLTFPMPIRLASSKKLEWDFSSSAGVSSAVTIIGWLEDA